MTQFDPTEMLVRFRQRATAVKNRPMPPVAGEERKLFIQQAQIDYADFAMIADGIITVEDGFLIIKVDLRPEGVSDAPSG